MGVGRDRHLLQKRSECVVVSYGCDGREVFEQVESLVVGIVHLLDVGIGDDNVGEEVEVGEPLGQADRELALHKSSALKEACLVRVHTPPEIEHLAESHSVARLSRPFLDAVVVERDEGGGVRGEGAEKGGTCYGGKVESTWPP